MFIWTNADRYIDEMLKQVETRYNKGERDLGIFKLQASRLDSHGWLRLRISLNAMRVHICGSGRQTFRQ